MMGWTFGSESHANPATGIKVDQFRSDSSLWTSPKVMPQSTKPHRGTWGPHQHQCGSAGIPCPEEPGSPAEEWAKQNL